MKRNLSFISKLSIALALAVLAASVMFSQNTAQQGAPPQQGKGGGIGGTPAPSRPGSLEKITVHGKSLEGNLEGDSPDREVFVYLPLSYATATNRRYPVVYFLHGYGAHAEQYLNLMRVSETADKDNAAGTAKEMILVFPDAYNKWNGSMYSNSPTTGNWETYITEDLVKYVDGHYRTVANRESRGLAGHSMGGYGTWRIGMKYPEMYGSIYAMSSCCLMNNPQPPGQGRGGAAAGQAKQGPPPDQAKGPAPADQAKGKGGGRGGRGGGGGFALVNQAEAAAWSPNPTNPPNYFDEPTKDGVFQPAIAAKWVANSPLAMVDQYVPQLKKYKSIMMDVGLQDGLAGSNRQLDEELTRLGVAHTFETYEGDHTNHVKDRFEGNVLPFFSKNLTFPAAR